MPSRVASLSVIAMLAFTSAAFAESQHYSADLKASSEVPANDSKGTGKLDATYDTSSKKLTYTVTYMGLTGPATAAHFHGPAEPGANAGVLIPIKDVHTPIKDQATLTDAQAADLQAGKMYFNVHTAAHPGGEIRGQVTKAP
nr:CHRD domain-containing protein [Enhydrobacter aerosaccus]